MTRKPASSMCFVFCFVTCVFCFCFKENYHAAVLLESGGYRGGCGSGFSLRFHDGNGRHRTRCLVVSHGHGNPWNANAYSLIDSTGNGYTGWPNTGTYGIPNGVLGRGGHVGDAAQDGADIIYAPHTPTQQVFSVEIWVRGLDPSTAGDIVTKSIWHRWQ